MPRPKKPGAPEPKRRSRNGCWPCKGRKVKCGEEHPTCVNCQRTGDTCDYSIRLNWEGRRVKREAIRNNGASNYGSSQGSEAPLGTPVPFAFVYHTAPEARNPIPATQLMVEPALVSPKEGTNSTKNPPPVQFVGIINEAMDGHASKVGNGSSIPSRCRGNASGERPAMTPIQPIAFSSPLGQPAEQGIASPDSKLQQSFTRRWSNSSSAFQRPHKRTKSISEPKDTNNQTTVSSPSSANEASSIVPPPFQPPASMVPLGSPVTPATPSSYSDEDPRMPLPQQPRRPSHSASSNPYVRLTVKSLLSGPPGPPVPNSFYSSATEGTSFYGYDLGEADKDVPINDDDKAISLAPPTPPTPRDAWPTSGTGAVNEGGMLQDGNGSDYYKEPVPIRIPKSLEPLPRKLVENKMHLLYFHHFLNNTARNLMPYDDQQSNPYRTVLPYMAVGNDHLLSLLLAYSASHRARILKRQEPAMRIARWINDVVRPLLESLQDNESPVSYSQLATAIMLASLAIISPTVFAHAISWHEHLDAARELMHRRFTTIRWMHSASAASVGEDVVCSFLWSWFAYLDVLGSLSGGPRPLNVGDWLSDYGVLDQTDDEDEIDCIMGFTTRCLRLLAQTAELVRKCHSVRVIPGAHPSSPKSINPGYQVDEDSLRFAVDLIAQLHASLTRPSHPCRHVQQEAISSLDKAEMHATNQAFHWAGIVQLHRRVLGKPMGHPDVRDAVDRIMECLNHVRKGGGTAEMGFLFPMFVAGVEMGTDEIGMKGRAIVLERIKNVEKNGLMQVRRARELMERVWVEGMPWEALLSNEFIG